MSIERSTELLRLALPWMSRQAAGLHPVSYAVWFDYVAQTNAPLRAAIDEHLAREGALDEFATHALFTRHVADVDPETAQRVVDQMQRVLGGIVETAGAAGAHAARYSASLAQLAGALARGDTAMGIDADATPGVARNGPVPRKLADVVAVVIADTGTMRSQIGGQQQQLADSRREIDRLRDEVRRARDDALRGFRIDVGHVAREQRVGGELVERAFARQVLVDGGTQRRIGLGDVVVPDGVAHRMQSSRLTRHPRQRQAQQLGAALDAHLVSQSDLNNSGVYKGPPSANGAHSCRAFCLGVTSRYVLPSRDAGF